MKAKYQKRGDQLHNLKYSEHAINTENITSRTMISVEILGITVTAVIIISIIVAVPHLIYGRSFMASLAEFYMKIVRKHYGEKEAREELEKIKKQGKKPYALPSLIKLKKDQLNMKVVVYKFLVSIPKENVPL